MLLDDYNAVIHGSHLNEMHVFIAKEVYHIAKVYHNSLVNGIYL